MGREVACRAVLDGRASRGAASRGTAQLETTELTFRGDFRARVPLHQVKGVAVAGKTLTVKWPGGALALDLGAQAPLWADKIRNPPSRLDKLGVKPTSRAALI